MKENSVNMTKFQSILKLINLKTRKPYLANRTGGLSGPAIKPGSYGECRSTLQKVDGEFIDAFGTEKWTEIVNTQLKTMTDIALCEILGFSF